MSRFYSEDTFTINLPLACYDYCLLSVESILLSQPLETELKVSATWFRLYSERLELTSAGESHGSP